MSEYRQLYQGGLTPKSEKLCAKDIPKDQRISPYRWYYQDIELINKLVGKGLRPYLVCPKCNKPRNEIIRYNESKYYDLVYCCKQCDPYDKTPYSDRTGLDDSDTKELIQYHIDKLVDKLEKYGVKIETGLGDPEWIEGSPDEVRHLFNPVVFDYEGHLWLRPKHMKTKAFLRLLVKLYFLYELQNFAVRKQLHFTATEIRSKTTKEEIDKFIERRKDK